MQYSNMLYKIHHFKSLTSTQDKAKEFSKKKLNNVAIIADLQTKGHGRFNRKWFSSKGSLFMSILLKPKNIENIQYLTFATAVAIVKAIKRISNLNTNIKWPNDVHYNKKKLCGILTEGYFGKENYVVVGIGLKVNQNKFSNSLKNTATSLKILGKRNFNIENLSKIILEEFFVFYEKYYIKNNPNKIIKYWKKYCDTLGKNIVIITKKEKLKGKAIGVDKNCNLLLKSKNKIIKVIEGDINFIL